MKKYISILTAVLFAFITPQKVFCSFVVTDSISAQALADRIDKTPGGGILDIKFQSKFDDTLQPLLIKVPSNYTKTAEWPLLVVLHGWGDDSIIVPSIDSMVQIGPFGRGNLWYRGLGEKDVFETIELAKEIFNIDPDRIYLTGFSMGGTGTFELGLKHPDIWAACVPVCGPFEKLEWVGNANNLPFWIITGSKDALVPPQQSKAAYEKGISLGFKHWRYLEYENMGHSFWINWDKIEAWMLEQKKLSSPESIFYCGEDVTNVYWVDILEKEQLAKPYLIEVEIVLQEILIKTENIAYYKFDLTKTAIDITKPITIVENGKITFEGRLNENGIFDSNLVKD